MALRMTDDEITITNTEPNTEVVLTYLAESGNVIISNGEGVGTIIDMESLIVTLKAIKTTQDNKLRRRREALHE